MQDGEALEARWQADLLEGDVVELAGSSTSLKNDIGYEYVTADLPDGSMVPMGGGMGDIARGESFPGSQETDQDVENTIASAVAASGLTLDDIQILHAPGPAPAVVVTSPDVAALAPDFRTLLSDLFGASPQCEGYYLEIRDPGGTPEVRTSASFVTGSGGMWINSSLASSWQVPH